MAEENKIRQQYGYGDKRRDASPSGSKTTRGSGGTGRVVGPTVRGDMDANGSAIDTRKRNWDTGQQKGFSGADVAYAKGSATSQPTDAKLQNPSGKGMPGGGNKSLGPREFPEPSTRENPTQAKQFEGMEHGFGPKVKGSSTGGNVQKGKTGGTDKTPKGSRNPPGVTGGKSYKGGRGD